MFKLEFKADAVNTTRFLYYKNSGTKIRNNRITYLKNSKIMTNSYWDNEKSKWNNTNTKLLIY